MGKMAFPLFRAPTSAIGWQSAIAATRAEAIEQRTKANVEMRGTLSSYLY